MVESLTNSQLAERCQAERERYRQIHQANEAYCLELFRRALNEQDEAAWEIIYHQYHPLVTHWVLHYNRFADTGEETAFFVNAVFTRMWQYRRQSHNSRQFDKLGQCLQYLKLCVVSVIEDYLRRKRKDALMAAVALNDYDQSTSETNATSTAERTVWLEELKQALAETIQDKRETLVAEESWVYDLPPRQIQTRHPELFPTVADVSQIKRNILRRLQRHPKLKAMREILR
ncbi:MAG: sigma-70 family RNA polymerase sigma factor [Anaerolineae bacterium]|nr:sigma-70 family RNA polymerase sigma factor [Anaerolineae bacterium]